jgi:peptide/nickel transport system substrate-binding protein
MRHYVLICCKRFLDGHLKYITLLLVCWMVLLLSACQPSSPVTAKSAAEIQSTPAASVEPANTTTPVPSPSVTLSPPAATPSGSPARGGNVVLGLPGQPMTLNPIINYHPTLRLITPLLYESLLKIDPVTAELMPGLAKEWHYSPDGKQVTFSLPPSLRWGDGTPLTAVDIAAGLQATQHPDLLKFSQIVAEDDQTLTFSFLDIDCAAITSLATLPLVPADQIEADQPVGSGPFIIAAQSETPPALELVRNPHYHGQSPWLDGITIRFVTENELPIIMSEGAGQFHIIGPLADNMNAPSGFEKVSYPLAEMLYVAINDAPLNDEPLPPPFRRALLMALNREEIVAELLGGEGTLLAGSLLPGHWAAPDGDVLPLPAYTPEEARSLLAQIGLRDSDWDGWLEREGKPLQLSIRLNGHSNLHQRLGWLVSSYYRDLGLFARAESVPPDSVIDDLFTHDFTLAIFRWPILPDPDQRPYWHSKENEEGIGFNFTSYSNPQVDQLLEQAAAVPGCQMAARAELYAQLQQILAAERPVDYVLAPHQHLMVANQLVGVKSGAFAPFTWNATEWYLSGE